MVVSVLCLLLLILSFSGAIFAYSLGPPSSVCVSMTPNHGTSGQFFVGAFAGPYVVETTASGGYIPGQQYKITIKKASDSELDFKGFFCQVRSSSESNRDAVGTFENFNTSKAQNLACTTSKGAVAHKNADPVSSFEAEWRAPSTGVGNLAVYCTIVQIQTKFWVKFPSPEFIDLTSTTTLPATPTSTVPSATQTQQHATTNTATATLAVAVMPTSVAPSIAPTSVVKSTVKMSMVTTSYSPAVTETPTSHSFAVLLGQKYHTILMWMSVLAGFYVLMTQ